MENNINQINLLVAIRTGELPSERSKEYWSDEEREELRRLFWAGKGISEISLLLQRSENAIIQQLVAMNLLTPPGKRRQRAPKVTIPYFGNMNMNDILPLHIQKYINATAKKYSPETLKKDMNALKLIFDTGVDNQVCAKSPLTKSIKMPRYETVTKKSAYSQKQYDIAYAFAKEWKGGLPIMLMLETGISRSELLGLTHNDIDRENHCIHINQGLVVYHSDDLDKQVMTSDGLKNKFRKRTIPIIDDEHWNRLCQVQGIIKVSEEQTASQQVFCSPEGKPYNPNNWVNRVFRPFMKALHKAYPEVPELSPHEVRHTRATLWIAQGIDPYMVARLLGHSDLKMLTRIYDHASTETLRKALSPAKEKETAN